MRRIFLLLLAHLTIGRRTAIQGQGPARFILPCFYLFLAFFPLFMAIGQDTKYEKGLKIVYFSVVTFSMGLMRDGRKNNV